MLLVFKKQKSYSFTECTLGWRTLANLIEILLQIELTSQDTSLNTLLLHFGFSEGHCTTSLVLQCLVMNQVLSLTYNFVHVV